MKREIYGKSHDLISLCLRKVNAGSTIWLRACLTSSFGIPRS